MMELLTFGDTGWGDELLLSMVMTILVSTSSLAFGLLIGTIFTSLLAVMTLFCYKRMTNIFVYKKVIVGNE